MSEATKTHTTAFVATVLDGGLRVAINKGSNAGIERGDQFLVIHQGPEIIDPETRESLGVLELVRGRGRIVQVTEKFSVLESLETRTVRRMVASTGAFFPSQGERELAPFEKVQVKDLVKPL